MSEQNEERSATYGMTISQRILHVGGRNNQAGYVEFGSTQAVAALVAQVVRDLPQGVPGYVPVETLSAEIKEPAQIKPSMSMHVSVEDYQRALAEWEAEQPKDCARSHPHEQMNQMCELRTEIARLTNKLARTEAQLAAVQQGVQPIAKELADMLERSITGLGHYRDTANWSEADEEHINECNALLDRFACIDEATHPTQQGLDALTDALTDCRRELQSCQSVIHLAGGFDPRYVSDAKAAIKKADAALAAQAKQGGV